MIIEIISTCITLLVVIHRLMTWNYTYWKERGIPHVKGKFPFGNVGDVLFQRRIMGEVYGEIYRRFEGFPVCGFFKIRQPVLLIRDPELVKTVLIKEFNNFHDNDFHCDPKTDPILVFNPFVTTGNKWKEVRAVLAPAQTPAKLKTVIPCTLGVCRNMIEFFNEIKGKEIEMTETMGHFTTDVTAAWGLGLDVNSFKNPSSDFRKNAVFAFGGDFKSNLAIQLAFYAPFLGKFFGFRMIRKAFEVYFKGVTLDVLQRKHEEKVHGYDLVQMLLDMNRDAKSKGKGREMDLEEVTGHVLTFVSEGYLTSSLTLSYIFYELAKHPEIQERAREEVMSIVSSIDELDYDKLQLLGYIDQIIDETLRLHSTVPVMTRLCTRPTTLDLGSGKSLDVEEGTPIAIPVQAIHMDPTYYPEPTLFDPERFSEGSKAARSSILYLGFSEGPRACIGLKLARTNLKLAISSVLLNCKIVLSSKTLTVEPDPGSSFLLSPKGGIWLMFKPIK